MNNIEKYKGDLAKLIERGAKIKSALSGNLAASALTKELTETEYQHWYTESHQVIKQLLPDRLSDFEHLYRGNGHRKEMTPSTYNIHDFLSGRYVPRDSSYYSGLARSQILVQVSILESVQTRFDSTLFGIRQWVQADLFESDLDAARELTKQGFFRAAGAVAGVVLEKHLRQVIDNHNVKVSKRNPTISDYNDRLKDEDVLDIPTWRQIQRLGDIRNLCDHDKEREPTKEEVEELINGVDKYMKTLF